MDDTDSGSSMSFINYNNGSGFTRPHKKLCGYCNTQTNEDMGRVIYNNGCVVWITNAINEIIINIQN